MLSPRETADRLSYMIKIDMDASAVYEQAIKNLNEENSNIIERFKQYRNEHERHIHILTELIRSMGDIPPERSKCSNRYLIEGFTAVRSISGTEGALRAMESNERFTNDRYDTARQWNFGPDIVGIMEEFYSDEKTHLTYIQDILDNNLIKST
jgi:rubrerythrin